MRKWPASCLSPLPAESTGPIAPDAHRRRVCVIVAGITVVAVTLARIVYNGWFSSYELVADEAQYWDWSRHLDWSYYSKGPGIAWLIAAATRVLGSAEWAIRVPAALSFAVVMGALAWLTAAALGRRPDGLRAAMLAPAIVTLVPRQGVGTVDDDRRRTRAGRWPVCRMGSVSTRASSHAARTRGSCSPRSASGFVHTALLMCPPRRIGLMERRGVGRHGAIFRR